MRLELHPALRVRPTVNALTTHVQGKAHSVERPGQYGVIAFAPGVLVVPGGDRTKWSPQVLGAVANAALLCQLIHAGQADALFQR
jgi:hypothetical protein